MTTSSTSRLVPPAFIPDEMQHRRLMGNWIREAHQGHLGNTGSITLNAGATTTTLKDVRLGANSHVSFVPLTANAASSMHAVNVYVSTQAKQTATITHANSASTDLTFRYAILG